MAYKERKVVHLYVRQSCQISCPLLEETVRVEVLSLYQYLPYEAYVSPRIQMRTCPGGTVHVRLWVCVCGLLFGDYTGNWQTDLRSRRSPHACLFNNADTLQGLFQHARLPWLFVYSSVF